MAGIATCRVIDGGLRLAASDGEFLENPLKVLASPSAASSWLPFFAACDRVTIPSVYGVLYNSQALDHDQAAFRRSWPYAPPLPLH